MNRAELLDRIDDDLVEIHRRLGWAITDGYHRSNAMPANRPKHTTEATVMGDDVKGPRYDLGIGSHRSRQAAQAALSRLRKAETHLTVAVAAAGHQRQPRPTRPTVRDGVLGVQVCVLACRRRVTLLRRLDLSHEAPLRAASRNLDTAVRLLQGLDTGDTEGQATAEPNCRVCGIRPRAERSGGRCETCKSWYRRNGRERPTSIDQEAVGDARAAAARRQHRGEGWGDESYSAVGRYRELEDQLVAEREAAEAKAKGKRKGKRP